ncbi:hypothetical protein C0585_05490 [Candidatus Woesearchaeota archaeon]|nr:MAG: hypothetical protein C0585_05490 [Candidatus Woesearchaeota archaeon]
MDKKRLALLLLLISFFSISAYSIEFYDIQVDNYYNTTPENSLIVNFSVNSTENMQEVGFEIIQVGSNITVFENFIYGINTTVFDFFGKWYGKIIRFNSTYPTNHFIEFYDEEWLIISVDGFLGGMEVDLKINYSIINNSLHIIGAKNDTEDFINRSEIMGFPFQSEFEQNLVPQLSPSRPLFDDQFNIFTTTSNFSIKLVAEINDTIWNEWNIINNVSTFMPDPIPAPPEGESSGSAGFYGIYLTYPNNGSFIPSNKFDLNFTINSSFEICQLVTNFSIDPYDNSTWQPLGPPIESDGELLPSGDYSFFGIFPDGTYSWKVFCEFNESFFIDTEDPFTIYVDGNLPGCFGLNNTLCDQNLDCEWDSYDEICFADCIQYDYTNQSICEGAFGGDVCMWDGNLCDPDLGYLMKPSYDGFSPCFDYDGNKTGCDMMDDCAWFSEPYCPLGDGCFDYETYDHGWCDPLNYDWGGDFSCWVYDGNKTACEESKEDGWTCKWESDIYYSGTYGAGDKGWCNNQFGGSMGCWDQYDEASCNSAINLGLPCEWIDGNSVSTSDGWCEEQQCWYYDNTDQVTCESNVGCYYHDNWCDKLDCWVLDQSDCLNSLNLYGLDCRWKNSTLSTLDSTQGWCEKKGCWEFDWTDQTTCESKPGCEWQDPYCNEIACWNFDNDQTTCNNNSLTGLNCEWKTAESWGWCEQKMCYEFGTDEAQCINETAGLGLSCEWDGYNCFEKVKTCDDYDGNMKGCFDTGYCVWDDAITDCSEPIYYTSFTNPGCWIFDGKETKCTNVTTCEYIDGLCEPIGSTNEVKCQDITSPLLCSAIPMLSTCCKWTDTGCAEAPYSTACWDNIQEPPVGAKFCDDYNAISSKAICEQIMGDPWYMPCVWDTTTLQCRFSYDNFGDEFSFFDIGSEFNCEAAGGTWVAEKWVDITGMIYTDEWCDMSIGFETCDNACWACETQKNGSYWDNLEAAEKACESSLAGCIFHEDPYSYNGFGWCDWDFAKTGNCDDNCWECWDETKCEGSNAECKWFVDPYNSNMGWCDDKTVRTCANDCFNCWDQQNCVNSEADCTWDNTYWFCKPQGSGGESYEICFDGIDNDADSFIDCGDPECAFDDFCGGSAIFGSECLSILTQERCEDSTKGFNCTWIEDNWGNSWCDMPGAQCWLFDDDPASCELEEGCTYNNMTSTGMTNDFCEINYTLSDTASCWDYMDKSTCDAASSCAWTTDQWCIDNPDEPWCIDNPDYGWCDYELWTCYKYNDNITGCNEDPNCNWMIDFFDTDFGWCDPVCYSRNSTTCENDVNGNSGVCKLTDYSNMGWCEPDNMLKGCWDIFDEPTCSDKDSCVWVNDTYGIGNDFCADKFMFDMTQNMDQSPPLILSNEECNFGSSEQNDICNLGIKDDPDQLAIGTGVFSMYDSAVCNEKFDMSFNGENKTTKFYWYLDTNGDQLGGCSPNNNLTMKGFDFKIRYEASMKDAVFTETKVTYKCLNGTWSPSKIQASPLYDKMCNMMVGGVVAISEEGMNKLSVLGLFDRSKDFRIYSTTANENGSSQKIIDSIGPVYYTPGSADFKFEDCDGFTDKDGDGLEPSKDPDCTGYLKFGYIDVEKGFLCDDGIDNDGNGLKDCNDYGCMYDESYCNQSNISDVKAPKITWHDTESLIDGVLVGVDTNEPTNATITFYKKDNYCINTTFDYLSTWTIKDPKLTNNFIDDNYDMWHDVLIDQELFDNKGLSYNFMTNTTYYYKAKVCDKSGNCALSACLSFKTLRNVSSYTFGFDLPPVKEDLSELLGQINIFFDIDKDGVYDDSIIDSRGYGVRLNNSNAKSINILFTNPNSTKSWKIYFKGVDILKALTLDVSNAFLVNDSSGEMLMGMNTQKWKEIAQKLGVDEIILEIPVGIASDKVGKLIHCPDDATSLDDVRCKIIDLTKVNCTFTTTKTTCTIPTSIGFSLFGVVEEDPADDPEDPGDEDPTDDSPSSSSGGGSAGGGSSGEIVVLGNITGTKYFNIDNSSVPVYSGSIVTDGLAVDAKLFIDNINSIKDYPNTTGIDYKYFQLRDKDITGFVEGSVSFMVEKEWMDDNDVLRNRIFLLRYNGNNWVQESTVPINSDDKYVYFTASISNFGLFAITTLPKVELEYLSMSNLVPQLIDLEMVIESGLSDSLMIERLEKYLGKKMDIKKTIKASHELVENLHIKRDVKSTHNKSIMTFSIRNDHEEAISFISVEAVPKSIVYDIYQLYEFNPRIYDMIIREDPVIQWSFGEADTAIVAWEIKELQPGDEAVFSYSLNAVFNVEEYPAPIIVKPVTSSSIVEAVEGGSEEVIESKTFNPQVVRVGVLFLIVLISSIVIFVLNRMDNSKHLDGESKETNKEVLLDNAEKKILTFIETYKKKNIGEEKIKSSLIKVGWKKEKVEKVFNHYTRNMNKK